MPAAKTTTRKTTATPKRPTTRAKNPDMVLKSAAGPIAMDRKLNTGVLADLADADPNDDMAELRVVINAVRDGCHDEASWERVRSLSITAMRDLFQEWAEKCQVDGSSVGESSGS